MPKTDVHIQASVKKAGKSHPADHAFVDFEKKKPERHDVTRMADYSRLIESKFGAEMGKALGLPDAITDIMEKHIRGGLAEAEATELGLPVKDYRLKSTEEKIVVYADRLVDIITDGVVRTEEEAERRYGSITAWRRRSSCRSPWHMSRTCTRSPRGRNWAGFQPQPFWADLWLP
jgi:hypothetical protein